MIVDFLYNNPTWLVSGVVMGAIIGLSALGLVLTHRLVPVVHRRQHNEFAGFLIAVVSVFYAVLLAFIAIAVWESFGKAGQIAAHEASLTGDIYYDAQTMPEPLRAELTQSIHDYVGVVLHEEWPAMALGAEYGEAGWVPLRAAHEALARFRTTDPIQAAQFSELLNRLNSLYDARRERILASEERLQPVVWGIVLWGLVLTVGFTYLFGMSSFRMHLLMTSSVAASIGLVVVLIVAFDYPFRGEVQVSPEAFEQVNHRIEIAHQRAAAN